MPSNGKGDVILRPPVAEAQAKALIPGGVASGAPEFILITEFGHPVVYQKYMEDASDAED